MAYKITPWKYSNTEIKEEPKFTAGLKTVKILDAKLFDEFNAEVEWQKDTYTMKIQCLEEGESEGATTRLTFWLKDSKTGKDNVRVQGTLNSLGRALFGDENFPRGFPCPADIIGGVVVAEISLKENEMGQSYPKVYHFVAASDDFSIYSDIEQFFRVVRPGQKN